MDLIEDTPFTIRPARPVDDIRCGQITAAAWMASEVPDRLPHAVAMFDDGAPLGRGDRYRLIAELPNLVAGLPTFIWLSGMYGTCSWNLICKASRLAVHCWIRRNRPLEVP